MAWVFLPAIAHKVQKAKPSPQMDIRAHIEALVHPWTISWLHGVLTICIVFFFVFVCALLLLCLLCFPLCPEGPEPYFAFFLCLSFLFFLFSHFTLHLIEWDGFAHRIIASCSCPFPSISLCPFVPLCVHLWTRLCGGHLLSPFSLPFSFFFATTVHVPSFLSTLLHLTATLTLRLLRLKRKREKERGSALRDVYFSPWMLRSSLFWCQPSFLCYSNSLQSICEDNNNNNNNRERVRCYMFLCTTTCISMTLVLFTAMVCGYWTLTRHLHNVQNCVPAHLLKSRNHEQGSLGGDEIWRRRLSLSLCLSFSLCPCPCMDSFWLWPFDAQFLCVLHCDIVIGINIYAKWKERTRASWHLFFFSQCSVRVFCSLFFKHAGWDGECWAWAQTRKSRIK